MAGRVQPMVKPGRPCDLAALLSARFPNSYSHTKTISREPMKKERSRTSCPPGRWWRNIAIPTLPVLACFLGGATEKWSEGIVLALLGLILLVDPPRLFARTQS